jgi:hypothetical protein
VIIDGESYKKLTGTIWCRQRGNSDKADSSIGLKYNTPAFEPAAIRFVLVMTHEGVTADSLAVLSARKARNVTHLLGLPFSPISIQVFPL